jgi:hypothetical protein
MVQQVTVSNNTGCTNPKNLGFCSVLQCTWDTNHVEHAKANPLNCVHDEDINNFRVRVLSMPASYALAVQQNGPNFTSTASISGNEVLFTLPANVNVVETWTITVHDTGPNPGPSDGFFVKLKRVTPP